MNLVLLIFLLCATLAIVLSSNGYEILSPGSLFCFLFILGSATLLVLGGGIDIALNTVGVIWGCSIAFGLGDMLASAIMSNRKARRASFHGSLIAEKLEPGTIDIRCTLIVCLIMVFAIAYSVLDLRGSAATSGTLAEGALVAHGVEKSVLSSLLNGFTSAVAYAFLAIFLFRYLFKQKIDWQCIVVVLFYLPIPIVTGSRIQILFFVVVGVCIYTVLLSRKIVQKKEFCIKFIKNSILVLIAILIAFYCLGLLTGKSQSFKLFDIVLVYLGAPISGFDQCINGLFDQTLANGVLGFKELSGLFNALGIKLNKSVFGFMVGGSYGYYPIVPNRGLYGNVYTALFYWMCNFGLIGTLLTCFVLSFLFSIVKIRVSQFEAGSLAPLCCFSIYYIPMFFLSIDDLFGDDLTYKRLLVAIFSFLIVRCFENGWLDWKPKLIKRSAADSSDNYRV